MRALPTAMTAAMYLVITPALAGPNPKGAANPKVDAAVKVFQAVAADPAKLKLFCEMAALEDKMGDKEDATIEGQIDKLAEQIGPDFASAWDLVEDTDENTTDGKVLSAALDQLDDKCPN